MAPLAVRASGPLIAADKLERMLATLRSIETEAALTGTLLTNQALFRSSNYLVEVLDAARFPGASATALAKAEQAKALLAAHPELNRIVTATRNARSFLAAPIPTTPLTTSEACLSGQALAQGHPALQHMLRQIDAAVLDAQAPMKTGAIMVLPNGTPVWFGPRDIVTVHRISKTKAELRVTKAVAAGNNRGEPTKIEFAINPENPGSITAWVPLEENLGTAQLHYGSDPDIVTRIRGRVRRWALKTITLAGAVGSGYVVSYFFSGRADDETPEDGIDDSVDDAVDEAIKEERLRRRARNATIRSLTDPGK